MTLKMGIERKLREAIPEVSEVVQVLEHLPRKLRPPALGRAGSAAAQP